MSSFWFDPMVQTAGMPGYVGAVEQGQAYNAAIAAQQAQRQATLAQANAYNPWANTPGGFGGQTAAYAGAGAAYGRATGGFNAKPAGNPSGQVERGQDLTAPPWQNPITSTPWEGAGFDPVKYLDANPDIKAAGADPWEHAQRFGFTEGRQGAGWNPYTYLQQNQDVKAAGVNPWEHAQQFGFKEGRSGLEGLTQVSGGGIGSDAARVPAAAPKNPFPVKSQDWQTTFNNMVHGSGGNPYALGGSPWYPSSRNDIAAAMIAAQNKLRAGQGWTIAQQPPAASQGTLTSRINQSIYDIGNAGTAFGQQGLDIARRGTLTPQDLAIPHAYPPNAGPGNPFGMNPNPGG